MNGLESVLWWQRDDLRYQNGSLTFAGRDVAQLAARFGTPSFVYSAARITENIYRIDAALLRAGVDRHSILYAMKANRFAPLLTYLKMSGLCGIDACSPAEVELALATGFEPQDVSFTATSLSRADYDQLARYDGFVMNCDSLTAIQEWGKRKPNTAIGIRINPALGISRDSNEKLQYAGGVTTKFGIYRQQFPEALRLAAECGLRVTRIHFHTGCGYLTEQLTHWEQIIKACLWFVDAARDVTHVNIGGGLGVAHLATDRPLDLDRWASIVARHFVDRGLHVEVEPGDYIAKDAGLMLLSKTYLETKCESRFLGVDAGFNLSPEPAHYALPFQPVALRCEDSEPLQSVHVAGNINEALDVWYHDALLPDMRHHSYLALINSGAYAASMASNHCMRGGTREFLLL